MGVHQNKISSKLYAGTSIMMALAIPLILPISGCSHRYESQTDGYVVDSQRQVNYQVIPITAPLVQQLKAQNKNNPTKKLAETAPAAGQNLDHYSIQPFDQVAIRIIVPNEYGSSTQVFPVLSGAEATYAGEVVGQDGMIHLPMLGNVWVTDKTIAEARQYIHDELVKTRIFSNPHVDVNITSFDSQTVSINGELEKPGVISITTRPLTVVEAIQQAGGIKPTADLQNASLRRADGTVLPLDLVALLHDGDMRQNYQLKRGDSLSVPDGMGNGVFILGEVKSTKSVSEGQLMPLRYGKAPLVEALTRLQTIDRDYGDYEHVYVIRNAVSPANMEQLKANPSEPVQLATDGSHINIYKLDASKPHAWALATEFPLEPRDVVYVAARPMADWNRFVNFLLPGGLGGVMGAAIIAESRR